MIRRIRIEVQIGLGNSFAPDGDTLAIFNDAVSFVASLTPHAFAADKFWLSYSAHVMSSLVSSLIRLSLASVTFSSHTPRPSSGHGRAATPARLLARLHRALWSARHHAQWAVADWALQRAQKVAAQLRQVSAGASAEEASSYDEVIKALEATGVAGADAMTSPAMVGLQQQGATPGATGQGQGQGQVRVEVEGTGTLGSPQMGDLDAWLNVLDGTATWGDWGEEFGLGAGGAVGMGGEVGGDGGAQWGW